MLHPPLSRSADFPDAPAAVTTAVAAAAEVIASAGTAAVPLAPAVIPQPAVVVPAQGGLGLATGAELPVYTDDPQALACARDIIDLLGGDAASGRLPLVAAGTGSRSRVGAGSAAREGSDSGADGHATARLGMPRVGQPGLSLLRAHPPWTGGPEGYRLRITPGGITIEAGTPAGWLYGAVTLWQLSRVAADGALTFDAQLIEDQPRFPWRGLMLDSARHFQSPQFIRQLLDWMALHKLNVLHWHLTDDQGWRIQIRSYPQLTDIGAWRVPAGAAAAADLDPATGRPRRYGGFYTQDDIRAIVAHAAARQVLIVPEIDLPGHASAAIASLPWLGAAPTAVPAVPADWGVYENVYAPSEAAFGFLEEVFTQVMELFPGPYIHVGGDEVSAVQWEGSPAARARARELGLASAADLRPYFTHRIVEFLAAHGRRAVGWDEVLGPGLPRPAVVMSWRGTAGARAAAVAGHDAVLSPDPALYFDHRPGTGSGEPPGRVAVISVRDVYDFQPMPAGLTTRQRRRILGLQANLWTEHVRTQRRAALMAFPRLAALAEVGWSVQRSWPDFERRLAAQLQRYRQLGIPYDDSLFGPTAAVDYDPAGTTAAVRLERQAGYGGLRYTLDGSDPTPVSPAYARPLRVPAGSEVRAASFAGSVQLSAVHAFRTFAGLAGRRASADLGLCTRAVPLALEDDAPVAGGRAVFVLDIENPCWLYPEVHLEQVHAIRAAVGQVPFNFRIGADREKIHLDVPVTPEGELEVRLDDCGGELYARLPLKPAAGSDGVTVLSVRVQPRAGEHRLCLKFAQHGLDPLWALDWVELRTGTADTPAKAPGILPPAATAPIEPAVPAPPAASASGGTPQ